MLNLKYVIFDRDLVPERLKSTWGLMQYEHLFGYNIPWELYLFIGTKF